jgi:hypothetical protein
MHRTLLRIFLITSVFCAVSLAFASCSSNNSQDKTTKKWVYKSIVVQSDSIYDFQYGDKIGEVKFRKIRGPVGSVVYAVCRINELSRFDNRQVNVKFYLLNQDAARQPYEPIEWLQQGNELNFDFHIPVVETVPTLLNFRLLAYQDSAGSKADDDDNDDTAAADDDNDNDDTAADDDAADDDDNDDDTGVEPAHDFQAWADFVFVVNEGTPGTGD